MEEFTQTKDKIDDSKMEIISAMNLHPVSNSTRSPQKRKGRPRRAKVNPEILSRDENCSEKKTSSTDKYLLQENYVTEEKYLLEEKCMVQQNYVHEAKLSEETLAQDDKYSLDEENSQEKSYEKDEILPEQKLSTENIGVTEETHGDTSNVTMSGPEDLSSVDDSASSPQICVEPVALDLSQNTMPASTHGEDKGDSLVEKPPRKRKRIESSPFVCEICQKCFSKPFNLHRHQETHTVIKPDEFKCTECPKAYIKKCGLIAHFRTSHGSMFYECSKCKQVFQAKKDLVDHEKIHKGEEVHKCPQCDRVFQSEGIVNYHMKRRHSNKPPIICGVCGKIFQKNSKRDLHMLTHTKIKAFKCELCQDSFATKYQVTVHIRRRHSDYNTIEKGDMTCKYCSEVLTSLLDLKAHLDHHAKQERPFSCNLCNRTFARINNLTSHKRRDHNTGVVVQASSFVAVNGSSEEFVLQNSLPERPFQCHICLKCYQTKNDLKRHVQVHSEERTFQCHLCGVKFKRQCHLLSHIECKHTEGKRYECQFCGKCFKLDRYRSIHEKEMHGDLQRFFCGACGTGFTKHVDLKLHVSKIHSADPNLHVCAKCGENFECEEDLANHGASVCKYCGQMFCLKLDMVKHEKKHEASGSNLLS